VCFCRCSAVSDEKREVIINAAVNATTGTVSEGLGYALESLLEEGKFEPTGDRVEAPALQTLDILSAVLRYQTTVRLHDFMESLTKRIVRDYKRIHSYYTELLNAATDPSARGKVGPDHIRERTEIIKSDFARKIEDIRIKYLVKANLEPVALLSMELPCALASFTVHMGNASREVVIPWNPLTARPDSTLCVRCRRPSDSIRICREFHWLCEQCWKRCAVCHKEYCPICKPKGCVHG
jgi:uncharacterized protein (UPF0262 family)